MPRAILMQHHADERLAFAFASVRAAPLGFGDEPRLLQRQAHEVVRARVLPLPILAVEMLPRPARIALAILVRQAHHFVDRRSPGRYLPKSQVNQPVHAVALVTPTLTP